ncbi:MAG TPA: RidA family protein [Solirubrobacteraceae bacterium]|jgi:enamine deaminase RidA (YjgF/YER057c/UK114 family)|nr:RidA family protein [Solirubrobacteraceae bacterium]
MSVIGDRLESMGIVLPQLFAGPAGTDVRFDLVHVVGDLAYVSGHGPMDGSRPLVLGKIGRDLTLEQGRDAARMTGLSILASLQNELGELDRIRGWAKVLGFVNTAPGFNRTPAVIDGFTDLILDVWGDSGRHARSAVGMAELPYDIPVEIEAVVVLG